MGTEGASCAPSLMPLDIPNDEDNFAYEKSWILVRINNLPIKS